MGSVCWLEDRDAELARARRLAHSDPGAGLTVVGAVLAEAPDDLEALRVKAEILGEAGRAAEARGCFDRLLTLDPGDARALIDRADMERDPGRALAFYERAIAALQARGVTDGAPDLEAARRGRAALLSSRRAF
jgi:tetratricopeptide (TPR) repeat protein